MPSSHVEVTRISNHGVWLLAHNHEHFMYFENFPWFKNAPVGKILKVDEPTPRHYHWPELDVDLTEEMILHPEWFPLASKTGQVQHEHF